MPDINASSSRDDLKRWLQGMENEDFEYFVADLWERQGWTCEVSQKSRDKSLDVLAEKEQPYHQRHAIQAKRYKAGNNVGGPKISEYASLRDQFDADAALVVATSGYTRDARERAETLKVKLIDGNDLVDMIEEHDAHDLVHKYVGDQAPELEAEVNEADLALQRMNAYIRMPPEDADKLGVSDGLEVSGAKAGTVDGLQDMIQQAEDVHVDSKGQVFVEDITEYIPASEIVGDAEPPIVAMLDTDAESGNWRSRTLLGTVKRLFS